MQKSKFKLSQATIFIIKYQKLKSLITHYFLFLNHTQAGRQKRALPLPGCLAEWRVHVSHTAYSNTRSLIEIEIVENVNEEMESEALL